MAKKLKIKLNKDGTVSMETVGIKGKKCMEYIPFFQEIADVNITSTEKTAEYYEQEIIETQVEKNYE